MSEVQPPRSKRLRTSDIGPRTLDLGPLHKKAQEVCCGRNQLAIMLEKGRLHQRAEDYAYQEVIAGLQRGMGVSEH